MPKKRRFRTVRVVEDANTITRGIIGFLNSKGHRAFRVNAAAVYDKRGFYRTRAEEDRGQGDACACLRPGLFAMFEVKFDKDTPSDDQLQMREDILAAGGIHQYIKTYQEFLDWYQNWESKHG